MNRWKNYGLWVSVAATIPMVAQATGLFSIPGNYNELVNGILGVLVLAGIINNPNTKDKGFSDDK